MSRTNANKSRAATSGSKQAASAVTPVSHDIVTGKFTDHDWMLMLDHDDADDFVAELLEELYDNVDRIIYAKYIQSKLVPYTVTQAKDDILRIIEWQFFVRDDGDSGAVYDGWLPDEEPLPAVTDCWAQGSVPKVTSGRQNLTSASALNFTDTIALTTIEENLSSRPQSQYESGLHTGDLNVNISGETDVLPSANKSLLDDMLLVTDTGEVFHMPEMSDPAACIPRDLSDANNNASNGNGEGNFSSADVATYPTVQSPGVSPDARLPVTVPTKMSELDVTADLPVKKPLLKKVKPKSAEMVIDKVLQEMLPSVGKSEKASLRTGEKTTMTGPIIFKKIDPSMLPNNQVNTLYCLIDPSSQKAERRRIISNGRQPVCPPSKKSTSAGLNDITRRVPSDVKPTSRDPFSSYQPPLLETMELANGVILREQGRTKRGPKQHSLSKDTDILCSALRHGLQPIRVQHCSQPLSAADLLDRQVPVVKPLVEVPPIPPINPPTQMAST